MGLLDKIQAFFREEEKKEEIAENVKVEEIDSVLKEKSAETEKIYNEKTEKFHKEVGLVLEKLAENTDLLEKVSIDDKKEDERLKAAVKMAKQDYIFCVQKFVENLKEKKIEQMKNEMDNFMKRSVKSYYKANYLIGKELAATKENVLQIKKLLENFSKENSGLIEKREKINEFVRKNEERKKKEKIQDKITQEIKNLGKVCDENAKKLNEIKEKIEKTKNSAGYKEREKLANEKKRKEISLAETESKVKEIIDKRIFEKYAHLETDDAKFAKKYSENPAAVLFEDEDLKIARLLEEIRGKIEDGSIAVKEPNKFTEKMKVEKEAFLGMKKEMIFFKEEIKEIEKKINGLGIDLDERFRERIETENKIVGVKNQIEILNRKGERIGKSIRELNSELVGIGGI